MSAIIPSSIRAQECKLKFAVAYNDGKGIQIGLTQEQNKFWEHDGPKKFKGMCLDPKEPNFVIVWSVGLSGAELTKNFVDTFNRQRATSEQEGPNTPSIRSSLSSATFRINPSAAVRGRADYVVLDLAQTPPAAVRQGVGYQDVPQGTENNPGQKLSSSDLASTIPDPTAAVENALKWLKKEKKL